VINEEEDTCYGTDVFSSSYIDWERLQWSRISRREWRGSSTAGQRSLTCPGAKSVVTRYFWVVILVLYCSNLGYTVVILELEFDMSWSQECRDQVLVSSNFGTILVILVCCGNLVLYCSNVVSML
jgi:hypothetical protein